MTILSCPVVLISAFYVPKYLYNVAYLVSMTPKKKPFAWKESLEDIEMIISECSLITYFCLSKKLAAVGSSKLLSASKMSHLGSRLLSSLTASLTRCVTAVSSGAAG